MTTLRWGLLSVYRAALAYYTAATPERCEEARDQDREGQPQKAVSAAGLSPEIASRLWTELAAAPESEARFEAAHVGSALQQWAATPFGVRAREERP